MTTYQCPGSIDVISREVHLARLAAFHPVCATCEHCSDVVHLPAPLRRDWSRRLQAPPVARTKLTDDGARGVFWNDWDEAAARRFAQHWAADLLSSLRRESASIVLGTDERAASTRLAMGIAAGLKSAGCRVLDVGSTARPVLDFAAATWQAAGALYVTGCGESDAYCGWDVAGSGGVPMESREIWLEWPHKNEAFARFHGTPNAAGSIVPIDATQAYLHGLATHYHALRPLHVLAGAPSERAGRLIANLFASTPCRLTTEIASPSLMDPWKPLRDRWEPMRSSVHVVARISEDGRFVEIADELGERIAPERLNRIVQEQLRRDFPESWNDGSPREFQREIDAASTSPRNAAIQAERHGAGFDSCGRIWMRDTLLRCDALVTLAAVLRRLSRSDESLSSIAVSTDRDSAVAAR